MIELRNVSFSYPDRPVLRDCSVQFEQGSLCAIVGPNGCGKTTLLRLLSRLAHPDTGSIMLENTAFSAFGRREFAKRVALMPQTRPVPEMTVREFVSHGRYPYLGFSQKMSAGDEAAVGRALQITETEAFSARYLRELSGGERQRAYLALLLAQETDYALLDEPTTYLDVSAQFALMNVMQKMRAEGKGVVAVLHDLSLAMQFCDRIIVMNNGQIAADGTPEALARSGVWTEVFGVCCLSVPIGNQMRYIFEPKK